MFDLLNLLTNFFLKCNNYFNFIFSEFSTQTSEALINSQRPSTIQIILTREAVFHGFHCVGHKQSAYSIGICGKRRKYENV